MDLGLTNKVVLVTGGALGIGAAIVRAVVAEGAVAVIADRSVDPACALEAELRAEGGRVHVVAGDLMVVENCQRAIAETLERFGRLDALVNNAAERLPFSRSGRLLM